MVLEVHRFIIREPLHFIKVVPFIVGTPSWHSPPPSITSISNSPTRFLKQLAGKRIHNAEALELYAIDRALVGGLVARLERRLALTMSVSERELYVSIGPDQLTGSIVRLSRET